MKRISESKERKRFNPSEKILRTLHMGWFGYPKKDWRFLGLLSCLSGLVTITFGNPLVILSYSISNIIPGLGLLVLGFGILIINS